MGGKLDPCTAHDSVGPNAQSIMRARGWGCKLIEWEVQKQGGLVLHLKILFTDITLNTTTFVHVDEYNKIAVIGRVVCHHHRR